MFAEAGETAPAVESLARQVLLIPTEQAARYVELRPVRSLQLGAASEL